MWANSEISGVTDLGRMLLGVRWPKVGGLRPAALERPDYESGRSFSRIRRQLRALISAMKGRPRRSSNLPICVLLSQEAGEARCASGMHFSLATN